MQNIKKQIEIETLKKMSYEEINDTLNTRFDDLEAKAQKYKAKADRYDTLDNKIGAFYTEDMDEDLGLEHIGEVAASFFGWL